ncbi:DUF4157 domain-containing protein [uncultured Aquimarina sp.]|uniref:eCIS core domain-containing protein n=1 Tax=uncultured Aquimarina sp. TaxID=575652 RepID=UPI00262FA9D1|nr:DUF4157 domain-containing protein [uncultured Aquimarina sp.]
MKEPLENTQEQQKETVQRVQQEPSTGGEATIADNRSTTIAQRKLRSAMGGIEDSTNPISIQRKNNTGLPDNLKSGIENLSGYSMDDVKVHYNSSKPVQLQAHAYAQGTDIHLAPGQEKHLPHEAWHVVQQKQGRVKPTRQLKSKVYINDDTGLEKEADVMGAKALFNSNLLNSSFQLNVGLNSHFAIQRKAKLKKDRLNLVGEEHELSERHGRRNREKEHCRQEASGQYWEENEFKITIDNSEIEADPANLRFWAQLSNIKDNTTHIKEVEQTKPSLFVMVGRAKMTLDNILFWINECEALYQIAKNDSYPGKSEEEDKNLKEQYENLRFMHENLKLLSRKYRSFQQIKQQSNTAKALKFLENNKFIISAGYSYLKHAKSKMKRDFSFSEYAEKRSVFMHNAGNAKRDTIGVWKIGNSHVKDIRRIYPKGDISYNLLSMEEYDVLYDSFVNPRTYCRFF